MHIGACKQGRMTLNARLMEAASLFPEKRVKRRFGTVAHRRTSLVFGWIVDLRHLGVEWWLVFRFWPPWTSPPLSPSRRERPHTVEEPASQNGKPVLGADLAPFALRKYWTTCPPSQQELHRPAIIEYTLQLNLLLQPGSCLGPFVSL